ncbi:SGNH/GDSL hydrolase family protein [Agromyces sp. NPDC056965]|uniref:SGNH/GDSL hydrolase family protein n=1 Tax=Agromyces sp. NPDC056965 TaxID=3345983 RepID=UPI00363439A6
MRTPCRACALGAGYVAIVAERMSRGGSALPRIVNAGVNGNRVRDLSPRLTDDVLSHHPDVVSIGIGVNDTWRRFDRDDETPGELFEAGYREVLDALDAEGLHPGSIVFVEPFLLPVRDEHVAWLADLEPKIEIVRRLARESGGVLVPVDTVLRAAAATAGRAALAPDGVHPSPAGHEIIADAWLDATRSLRGSPGVG